jgi:hypothetical protein
MADREAKIIELRARTLEELKEMCARRGRQVGLEGGAVGAAVQRTVQRRAGSKAVADGGRRAHRVRAVAWRYWTTRVPRWDPLRCRTIGRHCAARLVPGQGHWPSPFPNLPSNS